MTLISPPQDGWVLAAVCLFILSTLWIFMGIGFTGRCGYQLIAAQHGSHSGRFVQSSTPTLTESSLLRRRVSYVLFVAVTISVISAWMVLYRKLFKYDLVPSRDYLAASDCFDVCRSWVVFYGCAKIIIYFQLGVKVSKLLDAEQSGDFELKLFRVLLTIGFIAFAAGILWGSIGNQPFLQANVCVCSTPFRASGLFLASDWIISVMLLFYFMRPALRQLPVSNLPSRSRWKTMATEQFFIAIVMLLISPTLIATFIVLTTVKTGSPLALTSGTFPLVDLTLCCCAQAIASRRNWTKSNLFLCFEMKDREVEDIPLQNMTNSVQSDKTISLLRSPQQSNFSGRETGKTSIPKDGPEDDLSERRV
jgi:hypothetical protein